MDDRSPSTTIFSFAFIALVVLAILVAFLYTGGWLSPDRLTPAKVVDGLAPPSGPALGFRRNHAKGICFTGTFQASGGAAELSKAQMFSTGTYPVTGRFNLATANPSAADGSVKVRGLSLRIVTTEGQEWRSAMIDAPFFPVSTPQGFYELLEAGAKKDDPGAMKKFVADHPEFGAFAAWAGGAPLTASYSQDRYNSLDAFVFTNAAGQTSNVRWAFVPAANPKPLSPEQLKEVSPDFLSAEITREVGEQPQRWTMLVTVANPGDATSDPSKAWPEGRRTLEAGTLIVSRIEAESNGPCRDLNFDPTVLPPGISVSDDPFPAARSAAYAVSFDRRTSETRD
ncbi:MAG: catalase family peroxidase [Burkholderiaceae bacterium]|jgi:catalase